MSIQFKPTSENDRYYEMASRAHILSIAENKRSSTKEMLEVMKNLDKEFAGLGEP